MFQARRACPSGPGLPRQRRQGATFPASSHALQRCPLLDRGLKREKRALANQTDRKKVKRKLKSNSQLFLLYLLQFTQFTPLCNLHYNDNDVVVMEFILFSSQNDNLRVEMYSHFLPTIQQILEHSGKKSSILFQNKNNNTAGETYIS